MWSLWLLVSLFTVRTFLSSVIKSRGPESRSSRFFDVFSNKIARTLFKHCEVMPPVIRVVNNPMK